VRAARGSRRQASRAIQALAAQQPDEQQHDQQAISPISNLFLLIP
jgi:hypothetical protein